MVVFLPQLTMIDIEIPVSAVGKSNPGYDPGGALGRGADAMAEILVEMSRSPRAREGYDLAIAEQRSKLGDMDCDTG